jgi:hypothetical protein
MLFLTFTSSGPIFADAVMPAFAGAYPFTPVLDVIQHRLLAREMADGNL